MRNVLYIVWQPSNEISIPIIDEQHRGIVSTINSLYYFFLEGEACRAFEPTIDILNNYAKLHFLTEEALMRSAGYGVVEDHIALHNDFTNQMRSMSKNSASLEQTHDLLTFLKNWWLNHINKNDREFAAVVRKHLGL